MKQKRGKRSKRQLGRISGVVNSVKYGTAEISKRMYLEMDFEMVLYTDKPSPLSLFSSSFEPLY